MKSYIIMLSIMTVLVILLLNPKINLNPFVITINPTPTTMKFMGAVLLWCGLFFLAEGYELHGALKGASEAYYRGYNNGVKNLSDSISTKLDKQQKELDDQIKAIQKMNDELLKEDKENETANN